MKEVDPGHEYLLDSYDGGQPVRLTFVKREGEGYPFNVGHHPGTNCQEVWRASIARIQYLQKQEPCEENITAIEKLRELIWLFEMRAARRHERTLRCSPQAIEETPTCAGCGHIGCTGQHKSAATASPAAPKEVGPDDEVTPQMIAESLRMIVELWDAEHPDDPCGCVGASDDCKYPPPCELCCARLALAAMREQPRLLSIFDGGFAAGEREEALTKAEHDELMNEHLASATPAFRDSVRRALRITAPIATTPSPDATREAAREIGENFLEGATPMELNDIETIIRKYCFPTGGESRKEIE